MGKSLLHWGAEGSGLCLQACSQTAPSLGPSGSLHWVLGSLHGPVLHRDSGGREVCLFRVEGRRTRKKRGMWISAE